MTRTADHGDPRERWRSGTLLGRLSAPVRGELLKLGAVREYEAGAVLMKEGGRQREALLLLSGYVKVTAKADGRDVLLAIRAQGDLVGDLAALSGQRRSATVITCTPIIARFILPDTLHEFVGRHREAAEVINALVVQQLKNANRRRLDYATQLVPQRLARVVLGLFAVCGEQLPDGTLRLPGWFPQADLADLVGVSEDSVQRALRALRDRGLIDTGYRSLTILDLAGLADAANRPRPLP
jgi:CRP/FNR family transcriptional regulator, cyclic AMP receptor protein